MFDEFKKHINDNFPSLSQSKLLIAFSGGLDSIVLTHLLLKFDIALAHVNYQLRGEESEIDENFVKAWGKTNKIDVFVHQEDTNQYAKKHKLSIQMAAREIRYQWFDEIAQKHDFDYILTAHHLNDQVETFFINLTRSSGLQGLSGIPKQNEKILRPLLPFSRKEILSYATKNKLSWREDTSNASLKYLRNKIRHQIVPIFEEIEPQFLKAFSNSQTYLEKSQSLVDDYIKIIKEKVWKKENGLITISLQKLEKEPNIKAVLYELLKTYGFTEWNDVYNLITAYSGKQIFSRTHFLLKNRESLIVGKIKKEKRKEKIELCSGMIVDNLRFEIEEKTQTETLDYKPKTSNEAFFDKKKISFPLYVRKWKKGDYFYPLGMEGKQKLSNFYINQKISRVEKEKIWLLCDSQGNIIWVIGYRIDNRFKITERTKQILKITTQDD